MNKVGPIIIIEDDMDDQEVLGEVFSELQFKNEIIYFRDGHAALEHLTKTTIEPFLILSDINMPRLDGLALREQIHNNEDLRLKCIPYLFFTTSSNQQHVISAYSKSVQGFFIKPKTYAQLLATIRKIVDYWQECESPDYVR